MPWEVRINGQLGKKHDRREDALNDACFQLAVSLNSSVEIVDTETGKFIDQEQIKAWCVEHPQR